MSTPNQDPQAKTSSTLVAQVRVSFVTANIWRRPDQHGQPYTVTFERCYQVNPGRPRRPQIYDGLLPLALAKAADLAHTKILELQASQEK